MVSVSYSVSQGGYPESEISQKFKIPKIVNIANANPEREGILTAGH